MTELLAALNQRQRLAVRTTDGPVLIVAGAGTGKTRTLVCRLAYLAAEKGVPAEKLLAITFTTKAAGEMKQRIKALCHDGLDLSSIWIGTIHALCYEILKEHGRAVNLNDDFEIISPSDRRDIIKGLVKKFFSEGPRHSFKKYDLQLSIEKNSFIFDEHPSPFCSAYREMLSATGLLDFDDLIIKTLQLFRKSPETAEKLQARFSHISVDEYQDINFPQYSLLRNLGGPVPNLCAVGDADQAIYAFRGAQIENFLNFQRDFPDAKVIHLEENYRSTETILNAALQLIKKNRKRMDNRLIPTRPPGPKIEICEMDSQQEEAAFAASEIERLLGGTSFETLGRDTEGFAKGFSDIAILYRLHQQSHALKKALQHRGIPLQVAASRSLYEEPLISPVVDFLEVIADPHNDSALNRILTASSGAKPAEKLKAEAQHLALPLFSLLQKTAVLESLHPKTGERISDLMGFLSGLTEKSKTIPLDGIIEQIWQHLYAPETGKNESLLDLTTSTLPFCHVAASEGMPLFLKKIAFLKEGEIFSPQRAETVTLMTVHGAKGLEFPVVFLAGLEEGLFPFRPQNDEYEGTNTEEERRLFYVGMTRAKEKLYILHVQSRFMFGECKKMAPSSFLEDISENITKRRIKKKAQKKRKKESKQMKLFAY